MMEHTKNTETHMHIKDERSRKEPSMGEEDSQLLPLLGGSGALHLSCGQPLSEQTSHLSQRLRMAGH